jgi:4-amino-4-deoxy-L-arabinose transferase-like glycosyltransferase
VSDAPATGTDTGCPPAASPPAHDATAHGPRLGRAELLVLVALLVLAALTRLPGLDDRGRWDADQGTDMRVLRALVVDGEVPLLGPRTSIGTFHHGAVYYYLLAPAAFLSGADPVAVTGMIALLGIGAVAGIWWLARLVAGPLGAAIAGLLAAVSPAGIDESTFIWNPNPIPLFASLAYAGAILGWRTGRARWWVLAGAGAMVTLHLHVLGAVIVLPLAAAWVADLVRRRRAGDDTRGTLRGGLGGLLVIAAGFVPLLLSELGTGFAEVRGILEYVVGGGREAAMGMGGRIATVGLRSITWPLTGLLTDRLAVSMLVALAVIVLTGIAVLPRRDPRPWSPGTERWLAATLAVSVLLLAIFASSLAVIIPELPNDHYHAFLDPVVLTLVAAGLVRVLGPVHRALAPGDAPGTFRRSGVALAVIVLVAIGATAWPPATAPDGGWPLADDAAARVHARTAGTSIDLHGLPVFKNDNALRFPLERRGAPVIPVPVPANTGVGFLSVVIVCDPLFDEVTGVACGGPAEDAWLATTDHDALTLVDRFEAGPRRTISVYADAGAP